ncbi:MAG: hypothetical protein KC620_15065 [Myxococcales bacterium]|nr:hypothetical protein [Myxococcales bacterium]
MKAIAIEASPDSQQLLGDLRAEFLNMAEFNDGEQVHKAIEWVKLGPIPIPIPNPPIRVQALKLHDMHHILTGYRTDWTGEWEISGWEVGAGLHRNPVAWTFCVMGFTAGLIASPRRTLRAFARGRRCRTLFDQDPKVVFAMTAAEGHAFCGTAAPAPKVGFGDVWRALAWGALGTVTGILPPVAWLIARFGSPPTTILATRSAAEAA